MSYRFLANVVLRGKIEVLTGLHIGGSKEKLEIGGVDSPVIRDPFTKHPYIPGSSLKGKLRMALEFAEGKVEPKQQKDGKLTAGPSEDPLITRVFGTSAKEGMNGPTRLVIRDSYPDAATIKMWGELDSELLYTEYKPENSIDRITSEANPRFLERVIKGSMFDFEFVYGVYDFGDQGKTDIANFALVVKGLRLLEHTGLGGSVSRGYGKIKFHLAKPVLVKQEDYQTGSEEYKKSVGDVSAIPAGEMTLTLDGLQAFTIKL